MLVPLLVQHVDLVLGLAVVAHDRGHVEHRDGRPAPWWPARRRRRRRGGAARAWRLSLRRAGQEQHPPEADQRRQVRERALHSMPSSVRFRPAARGFRSPDPLALERSPPTVAGRARPAESRPPFPTRCRRGRGNTQTISRGQRRYAPAECDANGRVPVGLQPAVPILPIMPEATCEEAACPARADSLVRSRRRPGGAAGSSPCRVGAAGRHRAAPATVRGKVTFQGRRWPAGWSCSPRTAIAAEAASRPRRARRPTAAFQLEPGGEPRSRRAGIAWRSPPRRSMPPGPLRVASPFPADSSAP